MFQQIILKVLYKYLMEIIKCYQLLSTDNFRFFLPEEMLSFFSLHRLEIKYIVCI